MKTKYMLIVSIAVLAIVAGAFTGTTSAVSALDTNVENSLQGGGPDLEKVAAALGITVETLKQALQDAKPAECANLDPDTRPAKGTNCRADLDKVAETLGITTEELKAAFAGSRQGVRVEKLASAAETLGVSVEELKTALENARPTDCVAPASSEGAKDGSKCRLDLEAAASELGVTVEDLQSALGKNGQRGRGLDNAAETLGVTTEELQLALQEARPAECANLEPGTRPTEGLNCRPDFEIAAEILGVTAEELQTALKNGRGGPRGGPNGEGGQPPVNP